MHPRPLAVLVVVAVLAAAPGCGAGGRLASAADEVGRPMGASGDDVIAAAQREASGSGGSVDDVVEGWQAVVAGGRVGASRYEQVPQELRAVTCGAVTQVLADVFDGNPSTDPAPLEAVVSATGSLNGSVEAQALAAELSSVAWDLREGSPTTLALFTLKAGTCEVLG